MLLVALHLVNGKEIIVNFTTMTHMYAYEEEGYSKQTVIFFSGGNEIRVAEDYETVKQLIEKG